MNAGNLEFEGKQWFKDGITGCSFKMAWFADERVVFVRAVDKSGLPTQPSHQSIADMRRRVQTLRRTGSEMG